MFARPLIARGSPTAFPAKTVNAGVCRQGCRFLVCWLAIAAPSAVVAQNDVASEARDGATVNRIEIASSERETVSPTAARLDIKAFASRLERAEEPWQRIAAIVDLCGMYVTVVNDPRFPRHPKVEGLRGTIARSLQKELRDSRREANRAAKRDGVESHQAGAMIGRHSRARWQAGDEFSGAFLTAAVDPNWNLLAEFAGGSASITYHASGFHGSTGYFLRGGSQGGRLFDHGLELVSLIEAILHPDFWDASGGPGKAYYYQPLRVVVVRATTEVHEDLTDLLERLR